MKGESRSLGSTRPSRRNAIAAPAIDGIRRYLQTARSFSEYGEADRQVDLKVLAAAVCHFFALIELPGVCTMRTVVPKPVTVLCSGAVQNAQAIKAL